jgi:L-alanine-DL-glutamate epimerase-like enolase superfamily enzyme
VGGSDDPGSVVRARAAAARGVRTVKLKVVGTPDQSMLDVLRAVRAAAPKAALRLDANGALPLETAMESLAALAAVEPEMIEEPVSLGSLPMLDASPIPIALDESLRQPDALSLLEPHLRRLCCVAVVLKPTVLGGFYRCLALSRRAAELGLDVTVSHTFDGPIALAAAAHLALSIATPSRGSGLDRHAGLRAWPAVEIPCIGDDAIRAVDRPGLGVQLLGDGS